MSCTWVGYSSIGNYFCQEDPKRPDIWLDAECAKIDGLWSRPFDGKFSTCLSEKGGEKKRKEIVLLAGDYTEYVGGCVNVFVLPNMGRYRDINPQTVDII